MTANNLILKLRNCSSTIIWALILTLVFCGASASAFGETVSSTGMTSSNNAETITVSSTGMTSSNNAEMITASSTGMITVGSGNGKAGDVISIPIKLEDNPGIIAMQFSVSFSNTALTFISFQEENLLNGASHSGSISEGTPSPLTFKWADDSAVTDNTAEGVIITLRFKIQDTAAPGDYSITASLTVGGTYDIDSTDVPFSVDNGMITVDPAPPAQIIIDKQPYPRFNQEEGNVSGGISLSASIASGDTLSYQWYSNSSNTNAGGTPIPGATSNSFTFPASLKTGTYFYYCVVSATGGYPPVASSSTVLNVLVPTSPIITISKHPNDLTVSLGNATEKLSVTASVTLGATLNYKWYYNRTNSTVNGTPVDGGTQADCIVPKTLQQGSYFFYCVVSAKNATSKTTNTAKVTVESTTPVITINTHPTASVNVTQGSITGSLSVSASATKNATLVYRWYYSSKNSYTSGTLISGATGTSCAIPTSLKAGTYYIYCIVSASGANVSERSKMSKVTVASNSASGGTDAGGGGGAGGDANAAAKVTVKFDSMGGSAVSSVSVTVGGRLTKPTNPTKSGYSFYGWYLDKALKNVYSFNSTVTKNFTLYAKWTVATGIDAVFSDANDTDDANGANDANGADGANGVNNATDGVTSNSGANAMSQASQNTSLMTDIGETHWAANYIHTLVRMGIVNGYQRPDGTFEYRPNEKITRAELFKLIAAALKLPLEENFDGKEFSDWDDVAEWAKPYVGAVVKAGLVYGSLEGASLRINANNNISRQETIAIAVRALKISVGAVDVPGQGILDFDTTSDWAKAEMAFALTNQMINVNNGYSRPLEDAKRDEVAMALYKMLEYLTLFGSSMQ